MVVAYTAKAAIFQKSAKIAKKAINLINKLLNFQIRKFLITLRKFAFLGAKMAEMLSLTFMQNAFLGGILVSIICGFVGSLIVINKMSFIAGGVAHGAYGGIGLAFFFRHFSAFRS